MTKKPSTDYWEQRRGNIQSRKGGWNPGQGVTNHGYSMMDDFVGKLGFFQVLVLNVTGRLPEERFGKWLEATFICSSWPDARIWCNQLGALGGSHRVSPVASVCAGTLASDALIYGPGTAASIIPFYHAANAAVEAGASVGEFIESHAVIKGKLFVPGFARPVATGDERVVAMQAYARELGYSIGHYESLIYDIHTYLFDHYQEALNMSGYIGAFMLDQGYNEDEIYRILSMSVNGGIHACYAEYRDQQPDTFLPLHCEDIDYSGAAERAVPKREA